jgi:diaminopropionate ammonia-lyase
MDETGVQAFFRPEDLASVRAYYERRAGAPTPLRRLPHLAAELGIGELLVKDESQRFGLPAFKIVGAQYATARLLDEQPHVTDVAAATAGNHGRAVARVARAHRLRAHIHVPAGTAEARIAALESEGADVTVTAVDYDETVRTMRQDADRRGWTIVSDTAWPGYERIPYWIMCGYTWIFDEAASQWDVPPDVIVVQAGVGSLAGAAAGWLEATFDAANRPRLVIAEPEGSACVGASLATGARVALPSCAPTKMVGLRCGEVSPLAWPVIQRVAAAAIAVTEPTADEAVARLAAATGHDPAIAAGASGACGVAAVMALLRRAEVARLPPQLAVDRSTRILTILTEANTAVAPDRPNPQ